MVCVQMADRQGGSRQCVSGSDSSLTKTKRFPGTHRWPEVPFRTLRYVQTVRLMAYVAFSLIRTMTVGSGMTPDLLTPTPRRAGRSRAWSGQACPYRRWGVPPRPENVYFLVICKQEQFFARGPSRYAGVEAQKQRTEEQRTQDKRGDRFSDIGPLRLFCPAVLPVVRVVCCGLLR